MATTAVFETLMDRFFETIGLDGLQPDLDGVYGIDVDGEYNVHISGIDDHLLLFSKICSWDEVKEDRRKELFQHNVPDSNKPHPIMTLDSEGVVFVWIREPLREVNSTEAVQLFQNFLVQVDERRDMAFGEEVDTETVLHSHMGIRA